MKGILVVIAMLFCSTSFGQCDSSCKCSANSQVSTKVIFDKKVIVVTSTSTTPTVIVETVKSSLKVPVGHTHTCVNGHTWDHSVTAGHNCPVCGIQQFVVDSVPKMVNTASHAQTGIPVYSLPQSSPCANGQCPTSYAPSRQGFFRR